MLSTRRRRWRTDHTPYNPQLPPTYRVLLLLKLAEMSAASVDEVQLTSPMYFVLNRCRRRRRRSDDLGVYCIM